MYMQIVILCGGGGTRLWPISNDKHPKQLVPIIDSETLLTKIYTVLTTKFSPDQIWVATNEKYKEEVRNILPLELATNHILSEPEKRDNFAAFVAHGAMVSHQTSDEEPIIFVPCDDLIQPDDINAYNQAQLDIATSLEKNEFEIITAGIKPLFPNTQYGYVQIDPDNKNKEGVVAVQSFVEKPNAEVAQKYLDSGNYLWHKCNMSFKFSTLKRILKDLYPELYEAALAIETKGQIDPDLYSLFPKISFDKAILEKNNALGIVIMRINWDDIGNWGVVYNNIGEVKNLDNQEQSSYIQVDGHGNKIKTTLNNRKVAFVGVENLLVVESEDGLLIIDPTKTDSMKKVAEYFQNQSVVENKN
jgi:mannose-1-phosphate guanylyltransferase